jgi:multicomponent Na+:H+ antiporter subunit B
LILQAAARFLLPLLLLFSVFLLFRGHNLPGGGFTGGLLAAVGFALYSLAYDAASARQVLHVEPRTLIGVGLLVTIVSGVIGLFAGGFLAGVWVSIPIPHLDPIKIGTPLLFDIGVYLVVIGIALTIVLTIAEHEEMA